MTKRAFFLATAVALVPALAALAGLDYAMKCRSCGYACRVQIGGGMGFEQLTGYCEHDKKFVYLRWNRGAKKPVPLSSIWDSATGKWMELYPCPKCSKPFLPLRVKESGVEGPGFEHCPRCGKRGFEVDKSKGIIAFD